MDNVHRLILYACYDKALQASMQENGDEGASSLNIDSLEVFENIAFVMAKHADPDNVPDSPNDWLEQFGVFSIYEILLKLIALWGMNMETQAESKKNRPIDREMTTPLFLLRCKQLGLSLTELDLLPIGIINDIFIEKENDEFDYPYKATQSDFDVF